MFCLDVDNPTNGLLVSYIGYWFIGSLLTYIDIASAWVFIILDMFSFLPALQPYDHEPFTRPA